MAALGHSSFKRWRTARRRRRIRAPRGGKALIEPTKIPARGEVAVLADPTGLVFGVIRARGGDPAERLPGEGGSQWIELWTEDAAAAAALYGPIGEYTLRSQEGWDGHPEIYLVTDGQPRAAHALTALAVLLLKLDRQPFILDPQRFDAGSE